MLSDQRGIARTQDKRHRTKQTELAVSDDRDLCLRPDVDLLADAICSRERFRKNSLLVRDFFGHPDQIPRRQLQKLRVRTIAADAYVHATTAGNIRRQRLSAAAGKDERTRVARIDVARKRRGI